jgi:Ca2+-dependent lipid-binding protein
MNVPDILLVLSAEITQSFVNKSSNLYVTIKWDEAAMQRTSGVIEGAAPIWSEEFPVYAQSPPSWPTRLTHVL